jgi:GntR family transcriptional regulator / MocR family aminotransferase
LQADAPANGLVIGYGNTPAERLAPAVRTLAALAREMERESAAADKSPSKRRVKGCPEASPETRPNAPQ